MKSDLFSARKVNNKGGFSWILFSSLFWSSSDKDKRELRNYLGSKIFCVIYACLMSNFPMKSALIISAKYNKRKVSKRRGQLEKGRTRKPSLQ